LKKIRALTSLLFTLVILGGCLVAVWLVFFGPKPESARTVRTGGGTALRVETMVVEPQTLQQTLDLIGTFQADEFLPITSEISGRIVRIGFEEGEVVEQGAVLVELDDSEWRAQVAKETAEFELRLIEENRARELLRRQGVAQAALDTAAAERGVAQAEMQLARARLAKTRMEAPFEGVVGVRHQSVGSVIAPGEVVATLHRIDPIKLEFSVPEEYLPLIRVGQVVEFKTAGRPERQQAEIYVINPVVDPATRAVTIRARAENADFALLPGGFARVYLPLAPVEGALAVPPLVLLPGLAETMLFRLKDGRAERVAVTTGLRTAEVVEITSGLEAGDVVITTGVQQLRDGVPVEAKGDGAPLSRATSVVP